MPSLSAFRAGIAYAMLLSASVGHIPRSLKAQEAKPSTGVLETVSGRITSDSGRVVVGATVYVTRGPDRLVQQTLTGDDGRYRVTFDPGTGDYLVAVQAAGMRGARRRVTRQGGERELTADFVLTSDVATLDAVRVSASRPVRVTTTVAPTIQETGSSERWKEGVASAIPPTMAGDISTTMATIPGLTMGAAGPSMLGSSSSSNLTTLNGMAMSAGSVPRAARIETRVTGATFDATRGGFSGANVDLRLAAGSRDFQNRSAFLTADAPLLQATDAAARALGRTSTMWRGSAGMDGEVIRQALTYNVAVDVARTTRPFNDLTDADSLAYALAGVSTDSVRRVRSIAQHMGLPLSVAGAPRNIQRDVIGVLARFDDTRDTARTRALTMYVNDTHGDHAGTGVLMAPSAGTARQEQAMGAMLQFGTWSGPAFSTYRLSRFNVSTSRNRSAPYVDRAAVDVQVRTIADMDAADAGVASLSIGGRGQGVQDMRRWMTEASHEYLRNVSGRTHQVRAIVWGRVDGLAQDGGANLLGRWSFASLADLDAGRPSAFGRALTDPSRHARVWNGATAVSHAWTPNRFAQILYGLRIEGSGAVDAVPRNPALESLLGIATGSPPPRVHVSPRAGFTWYFNRAGRNGGGTSSNPYGNWFRYPTGVLRGGIGEFRDLWSADPFADARARSGRIGDAMSLTCVGSAVPVTDWMAGTTPTQCADGSGALSERAPSVSLLDRRWDVPRSWRASLDYNTTRWTMMLRLSGLASYDLDQPSIVDRNFSGVHRFSLADEGERSVFVSSSAIDARTGLTTAAESRRSTQYGRVEQRVSDLRGRGGQLSVNLGMDRFANRWRNKPFMQVNYTLQRIDRQARGFDGAAFGDPSQIEWAPATTDARHVWILQFGHTGRFGTLSMFARLQSGLPFTPLVQGDVNGDGRSGDRAWVSAPERMSDPLLANGLRVLETTGSATARACLAASIAAPGVRNGCRGPWTQTWSANWSPRINYARRSWRNRVVMNVFANNILAGLDQLLHGSHRLRGWGSAASLDPVLLIPRAFDPATRRFAYDVNPRFAETRPTRSTVRDPFRVILDVSLRLGTDYDLQRLRRAIEPVRVNGTWTRRGEDSLMALYLRPTSSIHRALVLEADSLFLTPAQIDMLRQRDSVFGDQVRALYRPLARYLATQPGGSATQAALDSVRATASRYWETFWKQPEIAAAVLSREQINAFPTLRDMLLQPPAVRKTSEWNFGANVPVVHTDVQPRR